MHISGPFLGHSLVSRSTWPQASSRRAPRCQPFLRPKFLSPPPPCPHDTAGLSVAIVCHFRSVRETGSHSFPIGFFHSASCFLRFIPRKESSFVSFFFATWYLSQGYSETHLSHPWVLDISLGSSLGTWMKLLGQSVQVFVWEHVSPRVPGKFPGAGLLGSAFLRVTNCPSVSQRGLLHSASCWQLRGSRALPAVILILAIRRYVTVSLWGFNLHFPNA